MIKVTRKFSASMQNLFFELRELDREMEKIWEQFAEVKDGYNFLAWMESKDRVLNMLNIIYRYSGDYETKKPIPEKDIFAYKFKYPQLISNLGFIKR